MYNQILTITLVFLLTINKFSQQFEIQSRISGGFKANIEQYPYLVSIRSKQFHKCGGAILKPNLIVTSANCLFHENISDLTIMAGSSSLDQPGQIINVKDFNIHEMYNENFNKDCNIALITLKNSLLFSPQVQPILLQKHIPKFGLPTLISGWGIIVGTGSMSHELRAAGLRILTTNDCNKHFGGKGFSTARILCAAANYGEVIHDEDVVGPCNGDEGSPLVCTDEMALCGIGWTWNYGCGLQSTEKSISGYTQINHPDIINWLKRYI